MEKLKYLKNNKQTMIVKKALLFVGFLAALLMPALSARAYDTPRIYIKELNISGTNFNAGGAISGDFLMWNTAKEIMSDLDYKISLEQYHNVFGEEVKQVSGQISPDKTLRQNFSYRIPQNIPTGDYKFRVQLFSQSGMALNWSEKDISIKGSSGYLVIGGGAVVKNGESRQPLIGVGFKIGEVPKIRFLASNPSSQKIEFNPSVAVYWFQTNMDKLDQFFGESQNLKAGESKEIEIAMPKYRKPGSYLAKVVLSSNNADISNTESFRWVLAGEGARILNVKLDSDFLKADKEVKIIVDFVGPADASDIGEASLSVSLSGQDGKTIFSQERTVQLSADVATETFNFTPESDAANPKVEAKIAKSGKELDSYSSQIKSPGYENEINAQNQNPSSQGKSYLILALAGLVILLIIVFFMIKNFSKNKNLFLMILAISAGLLLGGVGETKAATVRWNAPARDVIYNLGDPVNFQGDLAISSCDNGIDFKATAYVCDKDIANCFELGNKYNMNIDMVDIAYDSARKMIYIPDAEGQRIVGINDNPASSNYKQIEKAWGSLGSGTGQFEGPRGIFYDSGDDLIYVADSYNNRIVRFEPDDPTAVPSGVWSTWRAYNNAGDSLNDPRGVFVDNKGSKTTVYVADYGHNRVVRFGVDNSGNMIAGSWKTFSSGFSGPYGIFYDSGPGANYSRFIYVTDRGNERVVRFKMDEDGALVGGSLTEYETSVSGKTLNGPIRARLYQGWVYVAEGSSRVTRFNPDNATQDWQTFGTFGSGPGEFQSVYGVAYDKTSESGGPGSGFFYATSDDDKSIKKFKLDGAGNIILSTWENFDLFGTDGYDITYNLPASLPLGFQSDGTNIDPKDGSIMPAGAVFAKIEYEIVDTDPNNGQNFSSTTVEITGGGATTNATVKANVSAVKGSVTSYTITNPGSGYTSNPTVTIKGAGTGASAGAVTIAGGKVVSVAPGAPGGDYNFAVESDERIIINVNTASTPAACKMYAVHDKGSDDSQFVTINIDTGIPSIFAFGSIHNDYDIEGLDIDPVTNIIYAGAHEEGDYSGDIFTVDAVSGVLNRIGNINIPGYGVNGLAFRKSSNVALNGILWGWVSDEHNKGKGLAIIDKNTGIASMVFSSTLHIEGIAWNNDGTVLYASADEKLYAYNPVSNTMVLKSSNLPGETEALEMRPDGYLVGGIHNDSNNNKVSIFAYDPISLVEKVNEEITTSYNDIEGIGWPDNCPVPGTPVVDNLTVSPLDYCIKSPGDMMLAWVFTDAGDLDIQTKYQLKISRIGGGLAKNYDSGEVTGALGKNTSIFASAINSQSKCSPGPSSCANFISYGDYDYTWQVEVWNSIDASDGPESGGNFSTPLHKYPTVGFAPPPPNNAAIINIPTIFKATGNAVGYNSICYGSGAPCKSYDWDFCFTGNCTVDRYGAGEIISHTYTAQSSFDIVLKVTDQDDYFCSNPSNTKIITTKQANWKEVIPISE